MMMYAVGRKEIQEMDRYTAETIGLPGIVLMENAGAAVADHVRNYWNRKMSGGSNRHSSPRIVVVAGGGNNGGDGFVIARRLREAGYDARLCLLVAENKITGDARLHFDAYRGQHPVHWQREAVDDAATQKLDEAVHMDRLQAEIEQADMIVDAMLGTGARGALRFPFDRVVYWINRQKHAHVVSVDIPSGVDSDSGAVDGEAIQASETITFVCPKKGFFQSPGAAYVGQWHVANISVSEQLVTQLNLPHIRVITDDDVQQALPERSAHGHKGSFGHTLVIGGSKRLVGAPIYTAQAALASGTGLVTMVIPEAIYHQVSTTYPAAMFWPLADRQGTFAPGTVEALAEKWADGDVIALGPGLGRWAGAEQWIQDILVDLPPKPLVIDADGLNALVDQLALLRNYPQPVIITPHPGEMARLARTSVAEIEADRFSVAGNFAAEHHVHVVLKGHRTVLASPGNDCYVYPFGSDVLAKGGSGDVLTGLVAAMLSQGAAPMEAMIAAVHLHAQAAEKAAAASSRYSVQPTHTIDYIGAVISEFPN